MKSPPLEGSESGERGGPPGRGPKKEGVGSHGEKPGPHPEPLQNSLQGLLWSGWCRTGNTQRGTIRPCGRLRRRETHVDLQL